MKRMKKIKRVLSLALCLSLTACGSGGSSSDSSSTSNATLTSLKNFRSSLEVLSNIAPENSLVSKAAGSDATDWTSNGTFEYGDDTGLSLKEWFRHELDKDRDMTSNGNNFFNRLDVGLMLTCALFIDLGSDLEDQTTTITATAETINTNCDTNLPADSVSITGQSAVVTTLTGAAYEKKIAVDGMEIFVTNNDTNLKVAYGLYENDGGDIGDRLVYSLNKNDGSFQLEFMQYEGSDSETTYRAYGNTELMYVLGRSPQGSKANYFAIVNGSKAAVDFNIANGTTKSLCINLATGGKESAGFGSCMAQSSSVALSDFNSIMSLNMASNIQTTWTAVDENTVINFSSPTDMNSTTF